MSLYAEMRKTKSGRLDSRATPYRFNDRLIKDSKENKIPDKQKKLTQFFKQPPFSRLIFRR